jgi:SAM-dependent methyltransferase
VDYSFTRYLRAKVSVDDRALNQGVWNRMAALLPAQASHRPLRILEIGCGIGTMVERMVRKGLFLHVEYTGIDLQPDITTHAAQYLKEWSKLAGFRLIEGSGWGFLLEDGHRELAVQFIEADLHTFLDGHKGIGDWDLLVAHAFLDLVDLPATLARLLGTLRRGGVFYFTLNFDGKTILEPQVEPDLDEQIERLYHQTMDRRVVEGESSGDSQTGRRLFRHLREAGATILAAGASDWVVYPGEDGYPGDESYFLHYIIHTIQTALQDDGSLEEQRLLEWARLRHAQVERSELVYIAHQLDFVGTA